MKSSFQTLIELGAIPVNSQARGFLSKKKAMGNSKRRKPKLSIFEKQALDRRRESQAKKAQTLAVE